jgi:hypothetical protein
VTIFWVKTSIILGKSGQIFFFSISKKTKNKIIFSFVKFVATKNGLRKIFFSPLSFVAVFGSGIRNPGSGMGKNQDSGSGINIPDPPHWEELDSGRHCRDEGRGKRVTKEGRMGKESLEGERGKH